MCFDDYNYSNFNPYVLLEGPDGPNRKKPKKKRTTLDQETLNAEAPEDYKHDVITIEPSEHEMEIEAQEKMQA